MLCKVFNCQKRVDLEDAINNFLEENPLIELVNISYSASLNGQNFTVAGGDPIGLYSVIVLYIDPIAENPDGEPTTYKDRHNNTIKIGAIVRYDNTNVFYRVYKDKDLGVSLENMKTQTVEALNGEIADYLEIVKP